MNKEDYKNIINKLNNEPVILTGKTPYQFQINKDIFQKYKNYFINISEMLYCYKKDNVLDEMFCYCGNKKHFRDITYGYPKTCSKKCGYKIRNFESPFKRKDIQEKIKQTFQSKYNNDTFTGKKLFKEKSKLTKLKKYNNENYNNGKQASKTKYERYENHAYDKNKFEQSMLNKYGIVHHWKDKNVRKQIIETMLNDIDENGLNGIQRKQLKVQQTNLQRYNVKNIFSSKDPKLNGRQTCLKKYGVKSFWSSQQFKDLFKNKEWLLNKQLKEYQTKKKNNSFNKSEQEDKIYNYLLSKFNKNDIIRQYRSTLYPFNCDFYIKSLDLYIEYHGTWTHGNKPFKHSVEDLEKLKRLKNKNSKYYNNVIYTWSNLDIRKLNIFKKNKLNYKIFYNIEQFKNWFGKI